MIVAGGANFPLPVWDTEKQWHTAIYMMGKDDGTYRWKKVGDLPRPLAYGAAVSTSRGVICMGGNDGQNVYADVFMLSWDNVAKRLVRRSERS